MNLLNLRKNALVLTICATMWGAAPTQAADPAVPAIVLTSPAWVGGLKLEPGQLNALKQAVESALNAPIDAEQQCGPENGMCVVRAAREWMRDGARYREIVVNVHTVGHAQQTVKQVNGAWPAVTIQ